MPRRKPKKPHWKRSMRILLIVVAFTIAFDPRWLPATDYSEGAYANKEYSPATGDVIDNKGTAHNMVRDFWKRARIRNDSLGIGTNIEISTSQWTFVPSTSAITERTRIWLDAYDTNTSNVLINITTNALTLPATDQGFTLKPFDNPWELDISSTVYLIGITLGNTAEKVYVRELK
jgi:hypothetical protein